jgi:hypothetical protein
MPRDNRIEQDGQRLDYTCANKRFQTNIAKGQCHGRRSSIRGSVFDEPLAGSEGYSLWLEHVVEAQTGWECYWLMWYKDGVPTIPMSGILSRDDIANMERLFASLIP